MQNSRLTQLAVACCWLPLLACACTQGSGAVGTAGNAATTVATLDHGKERISAAELDERVAAQLREIEEQAYETRRQGLDQMINKRLVKAAADKKQVSEEQYLKDEVEAKVAAPSAQEIQEFFDQNVKQLPPGAKLDDYRERIVTFMTRQKHSDRAQGVFKELRDASGVEVKLTPPPKPRFKIEPKGPSRGPQNAKVTIVEFSDFQCPYCSRAKQTMDEVLKKYDGKVRLVFRQFPLSFHNNAHKAAEAGLCAHAQGKFWELHDAMFAQQDKLEVAALKELAGKLGLDQAKFDTCLDKGEMVAAVEEDMAAAEKVGVSGTPAFYVNGVMMKGAQQVEEFGRAIEAEL